MSFIHNLDINPSFPTTDLAKADGLLAINGDLSSDKLISAYKKGIFPWFDELPIRWWAPPIRSVFITNRFNTSKSLQKVIRKNLINTKKWHITTDKAFEQVMYNCAERKEGTWISSDMIKSYKKLHQNGYAHSFELWENIADDENSIPILIGGLYGVGIGKMFFGESMFSKRSNASKVVLHSLCKWMNKNDMPILDAQIPNSHTSSLGALLLAREDFEYFLKGLIAETKPQFPPVI